MHNEPSELAGKTVNVMMDGTQTTVRVEDWWDRVYGASWMDANGNPAAMIYAIRSGISQPQHPLDDEVLYGDGMLIHVTEIVAQ